MNKNMSSCRLLASLTLVASMVSASVTANAQQLPNNGFEGDWVNCIPWNSANTTTVQGSNPSGWCISNVVTPSMSLGNATVGEKKEGYNGSASSVRVFNKDAAGQIIPGYFTLGTTWATAKVKTSAPMDGSTDGGTWGGLNFTFKPDALSFAYIRVQSSGSTQPATAVIYFWSGETQQADVPAENTFKLLGTPSDPKKVTMINRERNVLGKDTDLGGSVTESSDFSLIAKAEHSITEPNGDWKSELIEIEYLDNSKAPDNVNVIFSSGDYFADRSNHKKDDALTVDDVKLVYYSHLSGVKYTANGKTSSVTDFDPYNENPVIFVDNLPTAITPEVSSPSGSSSITGQQEDSRDDNKVIYSVNVKNSQGSGAGFEDADGKTEHNYALTFKKKTYSSRIDGVTIDGIKYYADGNTIDISSRPMPMPEVEEIVLNHIESEYVYENSEADIEYEIILDTEKGIGTVTITNTRGADVDGESEHTYTLKFAPVSLSRAKGIKIMNATNEKSLPLTPAFNSKVFSYKVNGVRYDDNIFDRIVFDWFDGVELTSKLETQGDEYEKDPRLLVTVSNPNGGADYDGLTEHTYTFTFNKRTDEFRSVSLEYITINGVAVADFNCDVTEYNIDMPIEGISESSIGYSIREYANHTTDGTEVKVSVDTEKATVTLTVSNETASNSEGEDEREYILQFHPYYSRIEKVSINGKELTNLPEDGKTPATFAGQLPKSADEIAITFKSASGKPEATVTLDSKTATARITVTNGGKKDPDGKTQHVYIIQFDKPYFSTAASITINGEEIDDFDSEKTEYTLKGQLPGKDKIGVVLTEGSGSCTSTIETDVEAGTATITVTNSGDASGNYASTTEYILHFDLPYFSRLASLKVSGKEVAGFDKDVFSYTLSGIMPAKAEITGTAMKGSGKPTVTVTTKPAEGTATITVTNSNADLDGLKTHTYTLQFDKPVNSRLASISINGTPLADFDTDVFTYRLSSQAMPQEGEVTCETVNADATASISYNSASSTVTITVTADGADADGKSSHTYTLTFKKQDSSKPTTGTTTEYDGTLNIFMLGDDITGGGQDAKVQIRENSDGSCTVTLPDFALDLGDEPLTLGDIVVENVVKTSDGKGGYSYTGEVNGLELAEGEIVADVTLTGTTDAQGVAKMSILVLWEGLEIEVEFNGKSNGVVAPPAPEVEWSEYDGALSIEMAGSYLAENQKAIVYITDPEDGKCIFKLPNFSIDLDGEVLTLGDIVVDNVNVTEENGGYSYSGFVPGMEFVDGEIIADINLTGTVDADGNAKMTILVDWEGLEINVVFNGKLSDIAWMNVPGKLTVSLEGYDITEGGKNSVVKIAKNEENGTYTFLIPDFSLSLDASTPDTELGDIRVDDIVMTAGNSYDRYTGKLDRLSLAGGSINASVKIDGTITTKNEVIINVDVTWFVDEYTRVPLLVKFSNVDETPAEPKVVVYSGILTTVTDNVSKDHNVKIYLNPSYSNRTECVIEGIDLGGSRADASGNKISVQNVSVTSMSNGYKSYNGASTDVFVKSGMTVDVNLHGYSDTSDKFNLRMDITWIEEGISIAGSFSGNPEVTSISAPGVDSRDDSKVEYYNLNGMRVNANNLTPGIYIRRTGNKSEKILVK